MEKLILKLCESGGISGDEEDIGNLATRELSNYAEVKKDVNGNIIAMMGNKDSKYHVMVDAHIDQIGLVITHIDRNGFLKVAACGGIDRRVLAGATVKILGKKEIFGIICCIPPHLSSTDNNKVQAIGDISIDTGLDKQTVEKVVSVGDRAIICSKGKRLLNNIVAAQALDNRASVAALIRCAEILSKDSIDCKLTIILSVQEETSSLGAQTASFLIEPNEAISVDVSFAFQPGVPKEKSGIMGCGPMIGMSPILSKRISSKLIDLCKTASIPYQLEVMGGKTGTNADVISSSKTGIPCGLISIPQRNMHTSVEEVSIDDIEYTAKLLATYIKKKGEENA